MLSLFLLCLWHCIVFSMDTNISIDIQAKSVIYDDDPKEVYFQRNLITNRDEEGKFNDVYLKYRNIVQKFL